MSENSVKYMCINKDSECKHFEIGSSERRERWLYLEKSVGLWFDIVYLMGNLIEREVLNISNRKANILKFMRMGILNMGKGIRLKYKDSFSSVKGGSMLVCFSKGRREFSSDLLLSSSPGICRDCGLRLRGGVFEERGQDIK